MEFDRVFNLENPMPYGSFNPYEIKNLLDEIAVKDTVLFSSMDGEWKLRVINSFCLAAKLMETITTPANIKKYVRDVDEEFREFPDTYVNLYCLSRRATQTIMEFMSNPTPIGLADAQIAMCIMQMTGTFTTYAQMKAMSTIGCIENLWRDSVEYGWSVDFYGSYYC